VAERHLEAELVLVGDVMKDVGRGVDLLLVVPRSGIVRGGPALGVLGARVLLGTSRHRRREHRQPQPPLHQTSPRPLRWTPAATSTYVTSRQRSTTNGRNSRGVSPPAPSPRARTQP